MVHNVVGPGRVLSDVTVGGDGEQVEVLQYKRKETSFHPFPSRLQYRSIDFCHAFGLHQFPRLAVAFEKVAGSR